MGDIKDLLDAAVKRKEIIFYDFETTGLSPDTDRPVQFSAAKHVITNGKFKETERLNLFINPGCPVGEKAFETHGLSNDFLSGFPNEKEQFPSIADFIGTDAIICGYNNNHFDDSFLQELYRRNGRKFPAIKSIDVYKMVCDQKNRGNMSGLKRKNLATVSCYLDVVGDKEGFHDSMFDVEMTANVFMKLAPYYYRNERRDKVKVLKVEFWKAPNYKMDRVYVETDHGTVYYSCRQYEWGSKSPSVLKTIDLDSLKNEVYRLTGAKSEYELSRWTGEVIA